MDEDVKVSKRRRKSVLGKAGVKRVRSKRAGNRGGRNYYATMDEQQRNIAKGIARVPKGRTLDSEQREGRFWDSSTGLFLRPKGSEIKNPILKEALATGLLMSEINGDPE